MTNRLKKIDLAHALGVDASLVSRYTTRGMPTNSVAAAIEWKSKNVRPRVKVASIESPGLFDYDQSRAKREHFAAMQAEVQARREIGELIEVVEVERMASRMGVTIRTIMEGFPATLAPLLVGLGESAISAFLASHVERVLDEASKAMFALSKSDDGGYGREP